MTIRCKLALLLALAVMAQVPTALAQKGPTGTLVIQSMTDGAEVTVNDKVIGTTPFAQPVPLPPGSYELRAIKAGYDSVELTFTIRARKATELQVDLLPVSGMVEFKSNVTDAEVYVDNELVGSVPITKELVMGDHRVLILKDGYNDFETSINVKPGERYAIDGALTPFEDFSPEVQAMRTGTDKAADPAAAAMSTNTVEPAPAWYAGLHRRWWVWAIAGAVVATAVVVPLAATAGQEGPNPVDWHNDSVHFVLEIGR